jgi:hypothetical protein
MGMGETIMIDFLSDPIVIAMCVWGFVLLIQDLFDRFASCKHQFCYFCGRKMDEVTHVLPVE